MRLCIVQQSDFFYHLCAQFSTPSAFPLLLLVVLSQQVKGEARMLALFKESRLLLCYRGQGSKRKAVFPYIQWGSERH